MTSTPLDDQLGHPSGGGPLELAAPGTPELSAEPADEPDLATKPAKSPKPRAVLRALVESLVLALLIFFLIGSLVRNFKIDGQSMVPTMQHGQHILVNKAVYAHVDVNAPLRLLPGRGEIGRKVIYPFHTPRQGEIIVFEPPSHTAPPPPELLDEPAQSDYIKRVIATAGQTVKVLEGKVYVDGQPLDEHAYLAAAVETECGPGMNTDGTCTTTVPAGHIFVMGDNRPFSSDSRFWGPLPLENVIGRAGLRYWPLADWGLVPAQSYGQP